MIILFFFSILLLLCSFFVIFSKNPVHSILFLVLVFFNASGILLLLNMEFLAVILLIIYVGAIAVLFLFVVMMLNIRILELADSYFRYIPVALLISFIFFVEIFTVLFSIFGRGFFLLSNDEYYIDFSTLLDSSSNLTVISNVLYTDFISYFILAGLVLLVAMIGSIILTLSHDNSVRKQYIYKQLARDYNKSVTLFTEL